MRFDKKILSLPSRLNGLMNYCIDQGWFGRLSNHLIEHFQSNLVWFFPMLVLIIITGFIGLFEGLVRLCIRVFTIRRKTRNSTTPVLVKAPGTKLLTLVDFLFSPKTVERTFKPLIADWRYEYFEALNQGRKYKAHWIS